MLGTLYSKEPGCPSVDSCTRSAEGALHAVRKNSSSERELG